MFRIKPKVIEPAHALIKELMAEKQKGYSYQYKLKNSAVGQKLLALSPEEQREFALAAVEWLNACPKTTVYDPSVWRIRSAMLALLKHQLPFEHDDLIILLTWSIDQSHNYWRGTPQMIKVVEDYLKHDALTSALKERIWRLVDKLESEYSTAETRQWVIRLKDLSGMKERRLPLVAGEAWSDAAINDIAALDGASRSAWIELLHACAKASGAQPTAKWLKATEPLLETVGFTRFKQAILKWFPLVDKPRTETILSWLQWQPNPNYLIEPVNADLLRALVWLCAGREDREIARTLTALAISAYRKIPGLGPRCVRVGNACVWALGAMPGAESLAQLALLKVKVKSNAAQKGIEKALAAAAKRMDVPQIEIEEMAVPAYGLQTVGRRREQLGEFTAELAVTSTSAAEVRWTRPDGKRQTATPQAVKEQYQEDLKDLTQAVKDIRKMLPAQRDRIENLYLEQRKWTLPAWRERYLDHPLVGVLARRLIWKFTNGDRVGSAIWYDGQMVSRDGRALDWLDDATGVELWHPIDETTEAVMLWRDWLAEHEIQQPFKQAHREIYLLTDAERATRVYSNRFAAHIIKQHQFNALCSARGWRNKLRLMVDDECPPATRVMPKCGLRAEFWIEAVGDNYGTDTNASGTYLYLTTDQVRFYPVDARENFAHAGGGGYYTGRYGQDAPVEPLAVEQIPPLIFSEIMRDVDLFVGVSSVANDPHWADGGPAGRYRDYWASYSFGDLSETAKTRRQVLERLIPRLKVADRCRLTDRFLVVRGDRRSYKIHLGSGNILMEPDDQYLCIVPARGVASEGLDGKVFLPFEGDQTLAIILSKAFLLAADKNIKDPAILSQLGR
jgi:hypothetical protein